MLQRQIDATDHQIDKLVYDLYELTPEEIAIVKKMNKKYLKYPSGILIVTLE